MAVVVQETKIIILKQTVDLEMKESICKATVPERREQHGASLKSSQL